jgi:DNA modification methylase
MTTFTIKNGNAWDAVAELEDNSIGALATDPPYLISFMGKDWDKLEDNIAGNKDFWKLVLSKMKHGAHGVIFGHSRTHHRVMIALEDAGFEIRDTMMWLYGSGFPKNHNIGKSVDKLQGNKREVVGDNPNHRDSEALYKLGFQGGKGDGQLTQGGSKWEGWGTALKPAYEPIILVRKPLAKGLTIAKNCVEHNVGGINIDESRVGTTENFDNLKPRTMLANQGSVKAEGFEGHETAPSLIEAQEKLKQLGRWPANIILSHHPDCEHKGQSAETYNVNKLDDGASPFGQQVRPDYTPEQQTVVNEIYECHEDCPSAILDEQSGTKKGTGKRKKGSKSGGIWKESTGEPAGDTYGDSGGASRYFQHCSTDCPIAILDEQAPEVGSAFKATRKKTTSGGSGDSWTNGGKEVGEDNGLYDGLGGASRFFYQAKVAKKERNLGCDHLPEKPTCFAGSVDSDAYKEREVKGDVGLNKIQMRKNTHPTVKPVSLMHYLVRLITPEGETVLDPFMGSGATGMACALLERDFVGIDMDAYYCEISEARIDYCDQNKEKAKKVCKIK